MVRLRFSFKFIVILKTGAQALDQFIFWLFSVEELLSYGPDAKYHNCSLIPEDEQSKHVHTCHF